MNRAMSHRDQPTRRSDGRPETPADTRFFDLRESGYRGPIDQDGRAVGEHGDIGADTVTVRQEERSAEVSVRLTADVLLFATGRGRDLGELHVLLVEVPADVLAAFARGLRESLPTTVNKHGETVLTGRTRGVQDAIERLEGFLDKHTTHRSEGH